MLITELGKHDMIIGKNWLAEHDVWLDMKNQKLIWPGQRTLEAGLEQFSCGAAGPRHVGGSQEEGAGRLKAGEIILLVQQWAVGDRPNVTSPRNEMELEDDQEGLDDSSSDDDNDDGNNTHDNNGNTAKTKTKSAAKDAERRGKLPVFWYNLINQPVCLRETIWDYFKEPNESRRMVPADRCCSKCQPKYDLGLLNLDIYLCREGPQSQQNGQADWEDRPGLG
jgi:hypothetical protein